MADGYLVSLLFKDGTAGIRHDPYQEDRHDWLGQIENDSLSSINSGQSPKAPIAVTTTSTSAATTAVGCRLNPPVPATLSTDRVPSAMCCSVEGSALSFDVAATKRGPGFTAFTGCSKPLHHGPVSSPIPSSSDDAPLDGTSEISEKLQSYLQPDLPDDLPLLLSEAATSGCARGTVREASSEDNKHSPSLSGTRRIACQPPPCSHMSICSRCSSAWWHAAPEDHFGHSVCVTELAAAQQRSVLKNEPISPRTETIPAASHCFRPSPPIPLASPDASSKHSQVPPHDKSSPELNECNAFGGHETKCFHVELQHAKSDVINTAACDVENQRLKRHEDGRASSFKNSKIKGCPARYATRALAAAAVAVPARICRKLRHVHQTVPSALQQVPHRLEAAEARVVAAGTAPPSPALPQPADETFSRKAVCPLTKASTTSRRFFGHKGQHDHALQAHEKKTVCSSESKQHRNSEDVARRPMAFAAIPCIQGALAVRKRTSAEQPSRKSRNAEASLATSNSHPSESHREPGGHSMCWLRTVGWGGAHGAGKQWGFLECCTEEPVASASPSAIGTPQTVSQLSGISPPQSRVSASSSRVCPTSTVSSNVVKSVGLGVVLGTGNPEADRVISLKMLAQYIKVARSIRRISRAFGKLVTSSARTSYFSLGASSLGIGDSVAEDKKTVWADEMTFRPASDYLRPDHDQLFASRKQPSKAPSSICLPSVSSTTAPSSSDALGHGSDEALSEATAAVLHGRFTDYHSRPSALNPSQDTFSVTCGSSSGLSPTPLQHVSSFSGPKSSSSESNSHAPCVAACFMEVLIFLQSVMQLQARQKQRLRAKTATAQRLSHHIHQRQHPTSSSRPRPAPGGYLSECYEGASHSREATSCFVLSKDGTNLLSAAYWIVFTALWIERRLHVVAKETNNPALLQVYCCCRLFTSTDAQQARLATSLVCATISGQPSANSASFSRTSRGNIVSPAGTSIRASRGLPHSCPYCGSRTAQPDSIRCTHVSSLGSYHDARGGAGLARVSHEDHHQNHRLRPMTPGDHVHSYHRRSICDACLENRRARPTSTTLLRPHGSKSSVERDSPASDGPCCSESIQDTITREFSRLETVDLTKEPENMSQNWGPQIDTVRRFLALCFCAWSWIEDEAITSSSVVAILQHVWWCTNAQITFGLSDATHGAARAAAAKDMATATTPHSRHDSLNKVNTLDTKVFGAPMIGRLAVQRLRDAVAATSRSRLFGQYFGQQAPVTHSNNIASRDSSRQHLSANQRAQDTCPTVIQRGELPSSSAHYSLTSPIHASPAATKPIDFYAEYLALPTSCSATDFEVQKSLGYRLGALPEHVVELSTLWRHSLEEEDCCVRYCGSGFGCDDIPVASSSAQ